MHGEWLAYRIVLFSYWDDSTNRVNVHYYGSSFQGHDTHQGLSKHYNSLTQDLNKGHLYQMSVDGPNVNLKLTWNFKILFAMEF